MLSIKHTEIVAIIDWLMSADESQVEALYQILINEDLGFIQNLFSSYVYQEFINDIIYDSGENKEDKENEEH